MPSDNPKQKKAKADQAKAKATSKAASRKQGEEDFADAADSELGEGEV